MSFYLPFTLGVRRTRPAARDEEQRAAGRRRSPEAWREGVGLAAVEYEEHPAARVLEELRRAANAGQARRPWFVLGEPGAGKSTLLERWFDAWASELPEPRLGLTVPVLVRLLELRPGDLDGDPEATADRLWRERGARWGAAWTAGRPTGDSIYRADRCRNFQPVWLLDGLHELDELLREDERLFERLVVLPGAKLITCRTAVFETLRGRAERHKEREFEVLPLKPAEQENFLAAALEDRGRGAAQRKVVHKAVQSNLAVRTLAGNPLMLSLIAEVSDKMTLPATRAAFYRHAVQAMWHDKLPSTDAERLLEARDRALTELAQKMSLDHVEHSLVTLIQTTEKLATGLRDALERAGLLRVDRRRAVFRFLHLTFQEFYLARALEPGGLRQPLERHWADARYEETLALLASLLIGAGRAAEVDSALCWLLKWGARTHRRNPRVLWRLRRSPVRVVLHLLRSAGAPWEKLQQTASWIEKWLRSSPVRRAAVASDHSAPTGVLAVLGRDHDNYLRRVVATNPAAPAEVLAALARDGDSEVRCGVAKNHAAPSEVLAALAYDNDFLVRVAVARNPAASADVVAALARDQDYLVRGVVATNPATPAEVLAMLARDRNTSVRSSVAENSAAPPEVLAALAGDDDNQVRRQVVMNAATPSDVVTALARVDDVGVRVSLASNLETPAEVLTALARDDDVDVRASLALNPATPAEVLTALAHDDDDRVRACLGFNLATPVEVLTTLASDDDEYVRSVAATNSATPVQVLAAMARDRRDHIRDCVARNSATPAELLADLARDPDGTVRNGVATNPATPSEVLAVFVRDTEVQNFIVAENPNLLLEDIAP
jgi:hypothetical protein